MDAIDTLSNLRRTYAVSCFESLGKVELVIVAYHVCALLDGVACAQEFFTFFHAYGRDVLFDADTISRLEGAVQIRAVKSEGFRYRADGYRQHVVVFYISANMPYSLVSGIVFA